MGKLSALFFSALLIFPTLAGAEPPKPMTDPDAFTSTPDRARALLKELQGTRRLPIAGMSAAQIGERLVLMSDNGRFAVVGNFKLFDLWNGSQVKTLADADNLNRLDIKRMGIKDGDFAELLFGKGSRPVYVFVDPYCAHCHDVMAQMGPLQDQYTFHLVLAPVLGKNSVDTVRNLECFPDKTKAVAALISQDFKAVPDSKSGTCDLVRLQKTLIATKLMGIDGVPYIILPSTKTRRGGTKDLKGLLEADSGAQP